MTNYVYGNPPHWTLRQAMAHLRAGGVPWWRRVLFTVAWGLRRGGAVEVAPRKWPQPPPPSPEIQAGGGVRFNPPREWPSRRGSRRVSG